MRGGLHPPRSARLGGDPVFHQGDDRGQNAGNAAAGELPDQGADIDRTAGLCKGRNQGRQKLSADTAADCARNRVSGGAQVEFLRSPASYVASYRSRNNLNQQVNENA